jgi:ubiquinone/menaquinone biosynthesis C-methylase UbiE
MGADHLEWAKARPRRLVGVDLTQRSIDHTRTRLELNGYAHDVRQADAEHLPFDDASFDIVYSWGVLHHTGDMWKAIENAARLVKPGGRFVIAIYNRADAARYFNSERWQKIKRFYNHSPRPVQAAMELGYRGAHAANKLRQFQDPRKVAEEYRHSRGMALKTDLIDWLGGYPYEFASVEEIVRFGEGRLGLRCVRVVEVAAHDTANNEFVFERPASPSPA